MVITITIIISQHQANVYICSYLPLSLKEVPFFQLSLYSVRKVTVIDNCSKCITKLTVALEYFCLSYLFINNIIIIIIVIKVVVVVVAIIMVFSKGLLLFLFSVYLLLFAFEMHKYCKVVLLHFAAVLVLFLLFFR